MHTQCFATVPRGLIDMDSKQFDIEPEPRDGYTDSRHTTVAVIAVSNQNPRHPLTFVPQTSYSYKPTQGQLATIRSHASRLRYRRAPTGDAEQGHPASSGAPPSLSSCCSTLTSTIPHTDSVEDDIERPTLASPSQDEPAMRHQLTLSPLNLIEGACVDPFNRFPITLHRETQSILQYFHHYALADSNTESSELLPPRVRRHHERQTVEQILHDSFSSAQHMLALLSMAAARMDAYSPGTLTPTCSRWLNMQTVKHLQGLTLENLDHRTLYDIGCLAAASAYMNDETAAKTHFKAFSQLLPLVKINATHEHLMHFVLVLDVIFSTHTGKRPVLAWSQVLDRQCRLQKHHNSRSNRSTDPGFSVAAPPEGSFLVSSKSSALSFSAGAKLIFLFQYVSLPIQLARLFDEVAPCSHLARYVFLTPHSTPPDAHALCMCLLRLHHSLLCEHFDDPLPEAIRLCLIMNLSYLRTRLSARSANSNARRLAEVLKRPQVETGAEDAEIAELMVWICAVGASAATELELKDFFFAECLKVVKQIGLRTLMEVRAHIEKYLYIEAVHAQTVRALAERLE